MERNAEELSALPKGSIVNKYVAKVKPGKHSVIIPLGAKASISLKDARLLNTLKGTYTLELPDISGLVWKDIVKI